MALLSRGKSRISAEIVRTVPAICACSNRFGCVGGSRAYPVTLAPSVFSHSESQLPLNPVCPVRNTRRPFQNDELIMNGAGRRGWDQAVVVEWRTKRKYSETRYSFHGVILANACCSCDSWNLPVSCGQRAVCSL